MNRRERRKAEAVQRRNKPAPLYLGSEVMGVLARSRRRGGAAPEHMQFMRENYRSQVDLD